MGARSSNLALAKCAREDSFQQLFAAIGDKSAQDEIRAEKPEAKHCGLLEQMPDACMRCPLDGNPFGAELKDDQPHEKAIALRAGNEHAQLLEDSLDLYADYKLGLFDSLALLALTPEESMALKVLNEHQHFQKAKLQADIIAGAFLAGNAGGVK